MTTEEILKNKDLMDQIRDSEGAVTRDFDDVKRELKSGSLTGDQEAHITSMLKVLRGEIEETLKGLAVVQKKLEEYLRD